MNSVSAQFLHMLPCIFIKKTNKTSMRKQVPFLVIYFEHQYFPAVNMARKQNLLGLDPNSSSRCFWVYTFGINLYFKLWSFRSTFHYIADQLNKKAKRLIERELHKFLESHMSYPRGISSLEPN